MMPRSFAKFYIYLIFVLFQFPVHCQDDSSNNDTIGSPTESGPVQYYGYGLCLIDSKTEPLVLSGNYSCPDRFYCPNTQAPELDPISLPSMCPPTPKCQALRLTSQFCEPQGVYEPTPCPSGFYCPDYTSRYLCPQGFFCPVGTVNPIECIKPFSYCPAGSHKQLYFGGIIICAIFDAILICGFIVLKYKAKMVEKKRTKEEVSKVAGAYIGTIAESTHSKKLARFVTLEDSALNDESKSESIHSYKGLLSRAYWVKRYKICNYWLKSWFTPGKVDIVRDEERGGPIHEDENDILKRRSRASFKSQKGHNSTVKQYFSVHMQDLIEGFSSARHEQNLALNFDFKDLALQLPSGKIILNSVTGRIIPGRFTVIMGPSGAGKTTFMNVLMGKSRRTDGQLRINGREAEMGNFKKLIGYVPQDDVIIYELTVRENVWYQARTRLPGAWSDSKVNNFVQIVLDALELGHVAANTIYEISGGQRKRASIAMELVTCPSAILLDEPTSGLDATAALKLTSLIKRITQVIGITVIAVIHQPRFEIFEQFDDVLILASGGSTGYIGPKEFAQGYLEKLRFYFPPQYNPADVLMDIFAGKGLRIPEYLMENDNLVILLRDYNVQFENYDVEELTNFWRMSGMEYYCDFPGETVVVTPCNTNFRNSLDGDLSDIKIIDSTVTSEADTRMNSVLSAAPIVALNLLPKITSSFQKPDGNVEEASVTASHLALEAACQERGINFLKQSWLAHNRSIVQQYRLISGLFLEITVATVAGAVIGLAVMMYDGELYRGLLIPPFTLLSPAPLEIVPLISMIQFATIVLSGGPAGVKLFGEERNIYWHERAAGLNPLSYFVGKNFASTYRYIVSALHFTAFFMVFACANINFWRMYVMHLSVFYTIYGLAFICSMVARRENAAMMCVGIGVVMAVMCGEGPYVRDMRNYKLEWLIDMSFCRWAAEAWFSDELLLFDGVYQIYTVSATLFGYTLNRFWFDILCCAGIGFIYRIFAFILMVSLNRDKQR